MRYLKYLCRCHSFKILDNVRIIRTDACSPALLPAVNVAGRVVESLKSSNCLVVTAAPGAGKSTYLPLAILDGLDSDGKILMLEPRRIAARQIAERMAWLLGEPVGKTVGYRVRFDSKVSDQTRIEVLTEGILTRMLADDPTLEGVSVVIFDEFHERSLVSDLSLALTRESLKVLRPDLRIVIMSATIDSSSICKELNSELIESEGRAFPVEIFNSRDDSTPQDCPKDVAKAVLKALREEEGDILAFLPGEGEIRKCEALLMDNVDDAGIFPLYGMLSSEQQRMAIAPSAPGSRKIVLATPVAETSITIEGVRIVVDSGFCKRMVYDSRTGLSHLETVRISMDMARQRSGRAGRTAPGICHRLWTESTEKRMEDSRRPEILDSELSSLVLDIAAFGEKPESLQWLTPLPSDHLSKARFLLTDLNAIDQDGNITAVGRRLASLPCHPRVASMLLSAEGANEKALAADIAALLEEKDPLSVETDGTDICLRIQRLREDRRSNRFSRLAKISAEYRRLIHLNEYADDADDYSMAGFLLAHAYPERVARNNGCGSYLLANGETASVSMSDPLSSAEYLSVASVNSRTGSDGRILLAATVDPWETGLVRERNIFGWDTRSGRILAQTEFRVGRILLKSRPLDDISRNDIISAIADAAPKSGYSMFNFDDDLRNLQRRIEVVSEWSPSSGLPDVTDSSILSSVSSWLDGASERLTSVSDLKKIDLCKVIWSMLAFEQQRLVDNLAPSHIQVPTGSKIKVEYRIGADLPVIRVRLQECFGLLDTPRVNNGRTPVLMELLSPGFKPVQLTSDLRSFWSGTYFEVRKELRLRYPKHSWPEDPLCAEAIRGPVRKK